MRKIINAEGQEFVPVSTDDLVLDAVPTVNSFNSVTSDAVARAVAGASGEVPQVLEGDDGKVLTAVYDAGGPAVEWATPSGGESGVFVATYGVTRPSEIIAANNAGKVVICKRYNWTYTLVFTTDQNGWYTVWFSQIMLTPEMSDYPRAKYLKAIERVDSSDEDVPTWNGPYNFELAKASSLPAAARLVPVATASEAGQILAVNAQGTPAWTSAAGGGYTPVDLQTITAAPYSIPVGNREDVAVTLTGYTESDVLTIQLSSDCTDAVVKVNAVPGRFSGIQVMRGSDTVTLFGRNTVCGLTANLFDDAGRIVLSTNDTEGSGAEAPTSFAEMEVLPQSEVVGSVEYESAAGSSQTSFLVEIKGRNAILHV